MKKNVFMFLIFAPVLAISLAFAQLYYLVEIWTYDGPDIVFEVKSGEAFPSINQRLGTMGIISSKKAFHRYSQYKGIMSKFKMGSFLIKKDSNIPQVVDSLLHGKSIGIKVTVPEGKNLFQIAKLLERKGITTYAEFVNTAKDPRFIRELGIPADRVEGYLYPDTYRFSKGTPSKQIVRSMYSQFTRQAKKLNIPSDKLHSVVVLASIVEKETGAGHERPIIAGVFLNRLKKRMRLQSDPTTIYGIYEDFNGNLRKKHLREKTPYNTYKVSGLPKGPISNPGLQALNAVLHPAKHNYLYFVSKNNGTHIFTATYKEHRQAVNKYQKNRKARKGKSWRDISKK